MAVARRKRGGDDGRGRGRGLQIRSDSLPVYHSGGRGRGVGMHRGERREDGAEVTTGLDKCGPDLFGFTGLDNFFGSVLV